VEKARPMSKNGRYERGFLCFLYWFKLQNKALFEIHIKSCKFKEKARNIGLAINSLKSKILTRSRVESTENHPRVEDNVEDVKRVLSA